MGEFEDYTAPGPSLALPSPSRPVPQPVRGTQSWKVSPLFADVRFI